MQRPGQRMTGPRISVFSGKVGSSKIAREEGIHGVTPTSADDLPPLGELVADDAFWLYPAGG
jgi:hypothetical protein